MRVCGEEFVKPFDGSIIHFIWMEADSPESVHHFSRSPELLRQPCESKMKKGTAGETVGDRPDAAFLPQCLKCRQIEPVRGCYPDLGMKALPFKKPDSFTDPGPLFDPRKSGKLRAAVDRDKASPRRTKLVSVSMQRDRPPKSSPASSTVPESFIGTTPNESGVRIIGHDCDNRFDSAARDNTFNG
jgi:hypothetical protein